MRRVVSCGWLGQKGKIFLCEGNTGQTLIYCHKHRNNIIITNSVIKEHNTPGTRGGPGSSDRKLAVKQRKNVRK